ncbi:MAG: cupin domain-containing protein [Patescibacteria group bacterium]
MPQSVKERFEGATMGFIGPRIGAQKLGYNITVVPAGKRAFPFHNHYANEEMFFILEGEGEIRLGSERFPVKKGDFIACPSGTGVEHAHQIINTSTEELRYLAVSTKISPEIAEYPDTGKFGVLAENFRFVGRTENSLDYWEGE